MNFIKRAIVRYGLSAAANDGGELTKFLHKRSVDSLVLKSEFGQLRIPTNSKSIIESFLRAEYFGLSTIQSFTKLEGRSRLLLNIGANVGTSAVALATLGKYEKVVCFEPDPTNFAFLLSNTEKIEAIQCRQIALGRNKDILHLNINQNSSGRHSFRTDFGQGTVEVEVENLDLVTNETDEYDIFMDVEGWEIEVLRGAESSLSRCKFCALEWNGHLHTEAERKLAVEIASRAGFTDIVFLADKLERRKLPSLVDLREPCDIAFLRF